MLKKNTVRRRPDMKNYETFKNVIAFERREDLIRDLRYSLTNECIPGIVEAKRVDLDKVEPETEAEARFIFAFLEALGKECFDSVYVLSDNLYVRKKRIGAMSECYINAFCTASEQPSNKKSFEIGHIHKDGYTGNKYDYSLVVNL